MPYSNRIILVQSASQKLSDVYCRGRSDHSRKEVILENITSLRELEGHVWMSLFKTKQSDSHLYFALLMNLGF